VVDGVDLERAEEVLRLYRRRGEDFRKICGLEAGGEEIITRSALIEFTSDILTLYDKEPTLFSSEDMPLFRHLHTENHGDDLKDRIFDIVSRILFPTTSSDEVSSFNSVKHSGQSLILHILSLIPNSISREKDMAEVFSTLARNREILLAFEREGEHYVIKNLKEIPSEELADIVTHIPGVMDLTGTREVDFSILRILVEVPKEERQDALRMAKRVIGGGIEPPEKRRRCNTSQEPIEAIAFLDGLEEGEIRWLKFKALVKLPVGAWEDAITLLRDINSKRRLKLLASNLDFIPRNQRHMAFPHILSLSNYRKNIVGEILRRIPKEERADVLSYKSMLEEKLGCVCNSFFSLWRGFLKVDVKKLLKGYTAIKRVLLKETPSFFLCSP
jgi:hypothetical protein